MMIALGFWRCMRCMVCLSLWSALSVTEQVLMTQMSASSPCLARVCPRWSSALPIALLSAKFNLHPNVTNRIFIALSPHRLSPYRLIALHLEQGFHKLFAVEYLQISHLLTQSNIPHRYLKLVADADHYATFGGTI